MMAAQKEQIENWSKGKHFNRKKAKRDMNKLMRRQAKATPEDAPEKKSFKGWSY